MWIAGLVVASPFDLELSLTIVDRDSVLGWLVSRFGEWPAWGAVVASLVVLVSTRGGGGASQRRLRPMAWAVVVVTALCPGLITQALKFLWGRVRFANLAAHRADYTPFYVPAGPGAGESFPSGHVAMAMSTVAIPLHLSTLGRRGAAVVAWIVVLAYGLVVAWGRVRLGMHYLTDVLFSIGLCLLATPHVLRWFVSRLDTD